MRRATRRYPLRPVETPNRDSVRVMFERNVHWRWSGATFEDTGCSPSPYTRSNDITVRPYVARSNPEGYTREGSAVLWLGSSGDWLGRTYDVNSAITSGDFFIGTWLYLATAVSAANTYYVLGVQGAGATAAATAWAIVIGNAGNRAIGCVYSDGVTRSFDASVTDDVAGTGWFYIAWERVGSTNYLSVNGVVKHSFSFSSALNVPNPGVDLRWGRIAGGQGTAFPADTFFDMTQVKRASVFGGANFTPPDERHGWLPLPF